MMFYIYFLLFESCCFCSALWLTDLLATAADVSRRYGETLTHYGITADTRSMLETVTAAGPPGSVRVAVTECLSVSVCLIRVVCVARGGSCAQ